MSSMALTVNKIYAHRLWHGVHWLKSPNCNLPGRYRSDWKDEGPAFETRMIKRKRAALRAKDRHLGQQCLSISK